MIGELRQHCCNCIGVVAGLHAHSSSSSSTRMQVKAADAVHHVDMQVPLDQAFVCVCRSCRPSMPLLFAGYSGTAQAGGCLTDQQNLMSIHRHSLHVQGL
jgi:hypothetical protein